MTNASQPLPIASLSEAGKAPKERLASAADGQTLVSALLHAQMNRAYFNSRIKGMLDGNPPYDSSLLQKHGQAWRTNVNFLEGKASLSAALAPYYDLFAGSPQYAQVRLDYLDDLDLREEWSRIVSEEFDRMLKGWDGFDFNIQAALHDLIAYGKGFLTWPDKTCWQFAHIPQSRVLVPDGANSFSGKLDVLVMREIYRVHELYRFIRNGELARQLGWNVGAVRDAIYHAAPESVTDEVTEPEYYQRRLNDHDLVEGMHSDVVRAAHIYVAEFDGSVSHYLVAEEQQHEENKHAEFLFRQRDAFDRFNQALATFFFETLDGSWNGAAGLGKDLLSTIELKNRLKCAASDLTFLRSNITLQAKTANALQKTALVQMGSLNIIPPDYEVQQATIMGDVTSPIAFDRALELMLSSNTGIYRTRMEKPEGNPRTALEVQLQYQNQATLGNSAVNRFYLNLDRLYAEVYRRCAGEQVSDGTDAYEMARKFQDACRKRGVPAATMRKAEFVRAWRAAGNGSPFQKQQAMQNLVGLLPILPESARSPILEDVVAATANQFAVERYGLRPGGVTKAADHRAMALLENAAMRVGAPVLRTPTQNDVIHAQTHLEAGAAAANSVQQGAQPGDVVAFLDRVGQHTAEHLSAMATDPTRKNALDALKEQWSQLAAVTDDLKKHAQQQAQQQREAQRVQMQAEMVRRQMDPDTQLEAAKLQADMQRRDVKLQTDIQRKNVKAQADMTRADLVTANKVRNSNRTNGERDEGNSARNRYRIVRV